MSYSKTSFLDTFAPFNRRLNISQTSFAGLQNITKEIYRLQSNSCQSTFKDDRPFRSAFRMCNGGKCNILISIFFVTGNNIGTIYEIVVIIESYHHSYFGPSVLFVTNNISFAYHQFCDRIYCLKIHLFLVHHFTFQTPIPKGRRILM